MLLVGIEVPNVPVVGNYVCDCFGRVYDAAAAYGQNEVDAFLAANVDAFVDQGKTGIRNGPPGLDEVDAFIVEDPADLVQQAGLLGALASIMDEDLVPSISLDEFRYLLFRVPAENDLRRGIKIEIFHFRVCLRIFDNLRFFRDISI